MPFLAKLEIKVLKQMNSNYGVQKLPNISSVAFIVGKIYFRIFVIFTKLQILNKKRDVKEQKVTAIIMPISGVCFPLKLNLAEHIEGHKAQKYLSK
jgi:hypothetical protein